MKLTDAQIARLLYDVGWRMPDLETAIRIVLGESSGVTTAVNVNRNGSIDRGLFQINDRYHPQFPVADAFDPVRNARYAFAVYNRQRGFRAGRSAWWGPTQFHTLKRDKKSGQMVPDTARVERAKRAAQLVGQDPLPLPDQGPVKPPGPGPGPGQAGGGALLLLVLVGAGLLITR